MKEAALGDFKKICVFVESRFRRARVKASRTLVALLAAVEAKHGWVLGAYAVLFGVLVLKQFPGALQKVSESVGLGERARSNIESLAHGVPYAIAAVTMVLLEVAPQI